jgi:hypothetical protein
MLFYFNLKIAQFRRLNITFYFFLWTLIKVFSKRIDLKREYKKFMVYTRINLKNAFFLLELKLWAIRGRDEFEVEFPILSSVRSEFSPFWAKSSRGWFNSGLSPFRVESFRSWVYTGINPFGVGSIRGWVHSDKSPIKYRFSRWIVSQWGKFIYTLPGVQIQCVHILRTVQASLKIRKKTMKPLRESISFQMSWLCDTPETSVETYIMFSMVLFGGGGGLLTPFC